MFCPYFARKGAAERDETGGGFEMARLCFVACVFVSC